MSHINVADLKLPVGDIVVGEYEGALCFCCARGVKYDKIQERIRRCIDVDYRVCRSQTLTQAARQLTDYFEGKLIHFTLPVRLFGTDFQQQVWHELEKIPYASTIPYAEVARRLHRPDSVRAVASAIAASPLWIVVPCHRVIASDGSLAGYAGGLDAKRLLITLEATNRPRAGFKTY